MDVDDDEEEQTDLATTCTMCGKTSPFPYGYSQLHVNPYYSLERKRSDTVLCRTCYDYLGEICRLKVDAVFERLRAATGKVRDIYVETCVAPDHKDFYSRMVRKMT